MAISNIHQPKGLCWYVWVNVLSLSLLRVCFVGYISEILYCGTCVFLMSNLFAIKEREMNCFELSVCTNSRSSTVPQIMCLCSNQFFFMEVKSSDWWMSVTFPKYSN